MTKTIVDFTDVESGGGRVRVPEDDYRAKVVSVKQETAKSGNEMLVWEFELTEGKHKKKKIKDYTVLQANSLWKLKNLLEAMGITVPSKKLDILPILKKVKGKELGLSIVDEEYENKISSKVSDYLDLDTLSDADVDEDDDDDDDEDEDVEEAPKAKKKAKKKKKEDDDDEVEELDLDEL